MLFNINSNITAIKAARFPALQRYRITFKSSGTDNIIDIKLGLNSEETQKIIDNDLSRFLKIRIFLINSEALRTQFINLSNKDNYLLLHEEIQKNKLLFQDINYLFEGAKNNNSAKIFNKIFTIPDEKLNFQSLGYYFYYDLEDYISQFNLDMSYIDKRIFWDKLNIIDIAKDDNLVNNENFIDVRKIKSLLNNKVIDNPTLNIDLEQSFNRKLKESKKLNINNSSYFSSCYLTKNQKNQLAFAFNVNYKKLLLNNSLYDSMINKSIDSLSDLYSKINKITNISIMRRQKKVFNNKNGKSYIDIRNSERDMCSTVVNDDSVLVALDDQNISFNELNTNGSFSPDVKTYNFVDKTAFENGGGIYNYGLKITVNNNLNILYKYLSNEHMSAGIATLEQFNNLLANPNNYNPLDDTLSTEFVNSLKPNGSQKLLIQNLNEALESFFLVLKVFGLDSSLDEELERAVSSMFDPENLNIQNISYFTRIYQKLQLQLINISNNLYDVNNTVEYWFNEIYEADKYIKYGYKFFNFSDDTQKSQFPVIDSNTYIQKINSEAIKYATDADLVSDSSNNTLYTYITPSEIIYSNNASLKLDRLLENQESIQLLEYSDVLTEIKKLSINNGKSETNTFSGIDNSSFIDKLIINKISNGVEEIASELSITINNSSNKQSNANAFSPITKIPNFKLNLNNKLDTSNLLLQIINNTSLDKKLYNFNQLYASSINNGSFTNSFNNSSFKLPLHLKSLLSNKTNLFKEDDKYLKNIKLYCKYILLFNIIHGVQYLNYNSETSEEQWLPLTKQVLDTKSNGTYLICKMFSYKNALYLIDGTKNINLPIYDSYFMLKIINSNTALPVITSFIRNKANTLAQISANIPLKNSLSPFKNKQTAKNSKLDQAIEILNKKIISSDIEISRKLNSNIDRFLKIKK